MKQKSYTYFYAAIGINPDTKGNKWMSGVYDSEHKNPHRVFTDIEDWLIKEKEFVRGFTLTALHRI